MGMFDDCDPVTETLCPVDGITIGEGTWQTKATDCTLATITLGDDMRDYGWNEKDGWFEMHQTCDGVSAHWCEAAGIVVNHIWVATLLIDVSPIGSRRKPSLWNIRDVNSPFRIRQ